MVIYTELPQTEKKRGKKNGHIFSLQTLFPFFFFFFLGGGGGAKEPALISRLPRELK